jgi:two-component system chemotaxis response regulator CheV
MTTLSNILLDKDILLESGTNELEVLVFSVADYTFGINVAKVREVLPVAEITKLPRAHSSIRGLFRLRNQVIPCVSLLSHLGIQSTRENSESTMILTDLNQQQTAFLVDQVERIHRLSWESILAVPGIEAFSHTPVTALARCEDRLIVMLDFEMILDDVTEQFFRTDEVQNPQGLPRDEYRVLLAEDSPTVREAVQTTLNASGYTNLTFFENGALAWKWIEEQYRRTERAEDVADLLIADVEMPQVDGFHLTKRMKDHPQLRKIPVMLYSSIITPDNRKKGAAVGADAQVAKPELSNVVELADKLIADARRQQRTDSIKNIAESCRMPVAESRPAAVAPAAVVPQTAPTTATVAKVVGKSKVAGESSADRVADAAIAPTPATVKPTATVKPVATDATVCQPQETRSEAAPASKPQGETASLPNAEEHEHAVDADEGPSETPAGVSPNLWRTFHRELTGRCAHLRECLTESSRSPRSDDLFHEVARTLHTIKSAAMVVPLDIITRCTHDIESLLDTSRNDRTRWPQASLESYTAWLERIVSAKEDVERALAAGAAIEQILTEQLKKR